MTPDAIEISEILYNIKLILITLKAFAVLGVIGFVVLAGMLIMILSPGKQDEEEL